MATGAIVADARSEVFQGTLDLVLLKMLEAMWPVHGYGIARRIGHVSENTPAMRQGTIYPALLWVEQRGWIKPERGTSETNRRAKFYSLSRVGRKKIKEETDRWGRSAATMSRFVLTS
jgi:PadR family transcriptional regulator, regulatory protein PadR